MRSARRAPPRDLVHRGRIEARSLLFDPKLLGVEEARRRVLASWVAGSRVEELADGRWRLTWPQDRELRTRHCLGLPLIAEASGTWALPHPEDDATSTPATESDREETSWLADGGVVATRRAVGELDPAAWVDPGPLTPLGVEPFPQPKVAAVVKAESVTTDPRKLAGLSEPSRAFRETVARMKEQARKRRAMKVGLLGRLRSFFRRQPSKRAALSRAITLPPRPSPPPPPSKPGFFRRLATALLPMRWMASQESRYLGKMMKLFESGRLIEALHHAIPLGGSTRGMLSQLRFTLPRPRTSLRLTAPGHLVGSAMLLSGPDLYGYLEQVYRRAAEKLIAMGDIEKAAYVLAELLKKEEEAVTLLEKHGLHRQAAELAELKDLAPGLVVRQWFLAGGRDHALELARLHGVFRDAVLRLERSDLHDEATALRLLWADSLAESGELARAADVAWPAPKLRHLTRAWLDRLVEGGGPPAARAHVRRLSLDASVLPEALAFLETQGRLDSPDTGFTRLAMAETLLDKQLLRTLDEEQAAADQAARDPFVESARNEADTEEPTSLRQRRRALRILARPLARSVLERALPVHDPGRLIIELGNFAGESALRTDLRPLAPEARRIERNHERVEVDQDDVGQHALSDVLLLPNGRLLVARGELGSSLLDGRGRLLAHFDLPCQRFVPSLGGQQVLGIARRGELTLTCRLDLDRRTARPWCELRDVTAFAPEHDAQLWFVGLGPAGSTRGVPEVVALDLRSERPRALWTGADDEGRIHALRADARSLRVVVEKTFPFEHWRFDRQGLVLRERRPSWPVHHSLDEASRVQLTSDERVTVVESATGVHVFDRGNVQLWTPDEDESLGEVLLANEHLVLVRFDSHGARVQLLQKGEVTPLAFLAGSQRVSVRQAEPNLLVLGDDRGRVLVLDLGKRTVVVNVRT
ncbi:MAG: bpX6 domain-containing protein [Acidobacteriota bacterium]